MARVFNEGRHPGAYIVSEVEFLARALGTFAEGAVTEPGTVLGRITASKKLVPLDPDAEDGSEEPDSISFDHVDASEGDVDGVITARLTAINAAELVWPEGMTEQAIADALAALETKYIIAR